MFPEHAARRLLRHDHCTHVIESSGASPCIAPNPSYAGNRVSPVPMQRLYAGIARSKLGITQKTRYVFLAAGSLNLPAASVESRSAGSVHVEPEPAVTATATFRTGRSSGPRTMPTIGGETVSVWLMGIGQPATHGASRITTMGTKRDTGSPTSDRNRVRCSSRMKRRSVGSSQNTL